MRKHAAKYLATPTFVDHTLYYMLVHHSRSSYILHIIDSTNVHDDFIIVQHWRGGGSPLPPPLDETLPTRLI